MSTIEERADSFEDNFLAGLNSSTIDLAERDRYRVWVDRFEDAVDNAAEAFHRDNVNQAREHLTTAMEVAVNIDHFMQRSSWNEESEGAWRTLRSDLNVLAEHHSLPTLAGNYRASR
jgi:hypothetical protein